MMHGLTVSTQHHTFISELMILNNSYNAYKMHKSGFFILDIHFHAYF